MEPHRELVGRVRLVLDPGPGVVDKGTHGHGDIRWVDPDVGLL